MREFTVKGNSTILIGLVGEEAFGKIKFPKALFGDVPEGTVYNLVHKRAGDSHPYPVVLDDVGDALMWTVSLADCSVKGYGECQLIASAEGMIGKTFVYQTRVIRSLTEPGEVPEAEKGWVEAVIAAGAEAVTAKNEAQTSAQSASTSAQSAQTSAFLASTSADSAEQSAQESAQHAEEAKKSAEHAHVEYAELAEAVEGVKAVNTAQDNILNLHSRELEVQSADLDAFEGRMDAAEGKVEEAERDISSVESVLNRHANDSHIHVTEGDKARWNNPPQYDDSEIRNKLDDMYTNAEIDRKVAEATPEGYSELKVSTESHISNADIHTTAEQKEQSDILWAMAEGSVYTKQSQTESGIAVPPEGARFGSLEEVEGLTTQDGEPSPQYPQEIKSIESFTVTHDGTSRTITPPRPLNKVGEYADVVDIKDGVYRYKTERKPVRVTRYAYSSILRSYRYMSTVNSTISPVDYCMSPSYAYDGRAGADPSALHSGIRIANNEGQMRVVAEIDSEETWIDIDTLYALKDETTEPISTDDLTFLRSLRNIQSTDVVTVTDNWGRDVSYIMDYLLEHHGITAEEVISQIPIATGSNIGLIKTSTADAVYTLSTGNIKAQGLSVADYNTKNDTAFVSKGTLENVLADRLKEPRFELIETINIVGGETSFTRTAEPNGTPYAFKALRVCFINVLPDDTSVNRLMRINVYNVSNALVGGIYNDNWRTQPYGVMDVYERFGFWETEKHQASALGAWNGISVFPAMSTRIIAYADKPITKLTIEASTTGSYFASGNFEIYGIRA